MRAFSFRSSNWQAISLISLLSTLSFEPTINLGVDWQPVKAVKLDAAKNSLRFHMVFQSNVWHLPGQFCTVFFPVIK